MKLIIINGSPAAGKTTVAEKLHRDLSMSLLADVDSWRKLISGWKENREESLNLAYRFTVMAVDTYLKTEHDVIVDKAILTNDSVIDALIESGIRHKAEVYEFILIGDKETIVKRAHQRGFPEDGLLTPEKVVELWDASKKLTTKRLKATVIDTSNLTPESVYRKIRQIVLG